MRNHQFIACLRRPCLAQRQSRLPAPCFPCSRRAGPSSLSRGSPLRSIDAAATAPSLGRGTEPREPDTSPAAAPAAPVREGAPTDGQRTCSAHLLDRHSRAHGVGVRVLPEPQGSSATARKGESIFDAYRRIHEPPLPGAFLSRHPRKRAQRDVDLDLRLARCTAIARIAHHEVVHQS